MSLGREELIEQADSLLEKEEWKELYLLLSDDTKNKFKDDPEICWRMAYAWYEYSNVNYENKEMRKNLIYEGFKHATRGYEKDKGHGYCNLWTGILLDQTAEYEGVKKRVQSSEKVKEHFEKALEKNPECPLCLHSLGVWYFEFSDMAWYEKKLLSLLANPPNCTYQDALKFLEAAEKAEPNFYSCNQLYLGKCYMKTDNKVKAKEYLEKCASYNGNSLEDEEAKTEAKSLLKKL